MYNLRLQYRMGDEGPLHDVLNEAGEPVEYVRNAQPGHAATLGPVRLPESLEDRPYVQLWWRYYYSGEQTSEEGGARDMLRLANIHVESRSSVSIDEAVSELPGATVLHPNYPNPFNPETTIRYELRTAGHARLAVYDMLGRRVTLLADESLPAGHYDVSWDAGAFASGIYLIRLEHDGRAYTRTATLLK
jgi:hypothetical protein